MSANRREEVSLAAIGIDATVQPSYWSAIKQPSKPDLAVELLRMITTYEHTNVQIEINNTAFNCHMMVLQCYSEFFWPLSYERQVVLPPEIVTHRAFLLIYDWMKSPCARVHREAILEVLQAALFLKISTLATQCWACLNDEQRICEADAVLLYMEARELNMTAVQEMMLKRVGTIFLTLVASEDFLQLRIDEVMAMLRSNSIGVNAEIEVFMSAVRWMNHDWINRKQHLVNIMKCVRFELFTLWQLVVLKRRSDSLEMQKFIDNPDILAMMEEALSYNYFYSFVSAMKSNSLSYHSLVTAKNLYASNVTGISNCLERMNLAEPQARQWIQDKNWSDHFDGSLKSSYNSFLDYLEQIRACGRDHWKSLQIIGCPSIDKNPEEYHKNDKPDENEHFSDSDSIPDIHIQSDATESEAIIEMPYDEFDPNESDTDESTRQSSEYSRNDCTILLKNHSTKKNLPIVSLSKLMQGILCSGSSNCVLTFGGLSSKHHRSNGCDVYRYLPASNGWDLVGKMPTGRQYHSAVFYQQRVYVVGGLDTDCLNMRPSKEMFSFDPQLRNWFSEPSMPCERLHFGLITAHMQIFLIGGENGARKPKANAFCYDPVAASWKRVADMCVPRSGMACVQFKNCIWAAGGRCSNDALTKSVERYDLLTDRWTMMAELPRARRFARMCAIGERVYVVGGEDAQQQPLSSVDVYCVRTGAWKHLDVLDEDRRGFDIVTLQSRFLIIGGTADNDSQQSEVECYCADQNCWVNGIDSLPKDLRGLACVSLSKTSFEK